MTSKKLRTIIFGIIFLVLSILYTMLFAPNGNVRLMDSYDLLFHMNRIQSLSNIFVSPVNFSSWGHVGNMTSLFYPWLTIFPGFLIFQLFGNPVLGFLVYLTVINFCTFVSAYYFMKKFSNNTLQSFLFSIIYTLAFFRAASVFYRAGLAEYISYIFIPMIFYEFYQLLIGKFNKWPLFALSFALVVMTHPLSAFTTAIMLVPLVLLVLFSKTSHSWKYWLDLVYSGVKSIFFVGLTTIGFTLPMYQQQKYISVNRPAVIDLWSTAKDPVLLFQDAMKADVRSYSFGAIFVFALILLLIFVWRDQLKYKIIAIEAVLALLLSTNLIPWNTLQDSFLNYLQFPWRFLNPFTFFIAIYLSHILAMLVDKRSGLLKVSVAVVMILICSFQIYVSGTNLNGQITLVKDTPVVKQSESNYIVRRYNQHDYYPNRSLKYFQDIGRHHFIVNDHKTKLHYKYTDSNYTVKYYNQDPVTMDIPVLVYKGLDVTINNEKTNYTISKRGTVEVKTKPGQNVIQLSYHYSTVAKAAIGLNVVSAGLLIWLCVNDGKLLYKKKKDTDTKELKSKNS